MAEDIDTISFGYDSPMFFPIVLKLGIHLSTFPLHTSPQSDPPPVVLSTADIRWQIARDSTMESL